MEFCHYFPEHVAVPSGSTHDTGGEEVLPGRPVTHLFLSAYSFEGRSKIIGTLLVFVHPMRWVVFVTAVCRLDRDGVMWKAGASVRELPPSAAWAMGKSVGVFQ